MKLKQDTLIGTLFGLMLGAILTISVMTLRNQTRPSPIAILPPPAAATAVPTPTPGPIQVFVNGAVNAPAVYTLPADSRVQDAITAAGGFSSQADTAVINLAQPLLDGAQIYVPQMGETAVPSSGVIPPDNRTLNLDTSTATTGQININTATLEQLDTLPGIGPSTAQKILDYRDANGPFTTIEDIQNVTGIGPAKYEQIKELITVGNN